MRKIETQLYVVGIRIILEITSIPGMLHLFTKGYDKNEVWLYKAVFSHFKIFIKINEQRAHVGLYLQKLLFHARVSCLFIQKIRD